MTRPPSLADLDWALCATVLGLAIGIVAVVVIEAAR